MNRTNSSQSDKLVYKGFWIRLFASAIDYGIILFPCYGLYILFQLLFHKPFNAFGDLELVLYYMTISGGAWLYDSLFWSSKYQATPGKMVLRLKVTDLTGERLSFKKASIRWLGKVISYFTFGIGYLIVGLTDKKQGLHDFIARTIVIQR